MSHSEGSQPPPWLRSESDDDIEDFDDFDDFGEKAIAEPVSAPVPVESHRAVDGARLVNPLADLGPATADDPAPARGWRPAAPDDLPAPPSPSARHAVNERPTEDRPTNEQPADDQPTMSIPVIKDDPTPAVEPEMSPQSLGPQQYSSHPDGGPYPPTVHSTPSAPQPAPAPVQQWGYAPPEAPQHHPQAYPHPQPGWPQPYPQPGGQSSPGYPPPASQPAHQPAPGYSSAPPIPGHQGPQNLAPPPGLDPQRLVRTPAGTPARGWRRALHTATGGLISVGNSKSQQQLDELIARVRQPIRGDFRLAVLSLKGGVGKTTTTIGLGSAFASLRGDRVIAVDANPDLGTLASRVPQQTPSTVRSLLHDPDITRYTDVRRHTSQAPSRLEVLASERDPAISEAFNADEYRQVLAILENFYNIIMTDCGTGLIHSAMEGVLSKANAIVLVTSPAVDGAQSASATLDWLNAHGYQRLVNQAVVVISASKPGSAPIDLDMLTEHFLGRTRAVQIIPYDDHLASGSFVDLDHMHRRTRTAFLELAATVADSFATTVTLPPEGAGQPWQG